MGNVGDAAFSSGDVMRRLRDLERRLDELASARRLENSTIGAGGIRVASQGVIRSDTFDGNLPAGDAGDNGWALGADRLAIRGALVSPIDLTGVGASSSNFAVGTSLANVVTGVIDVPSWCNQVGILVIVTVNAINSTGAAGFLEARATIDGVGGGNNAISVLAGAGTSVAATAQRIIDDPDPTIPVAGQAAANLTFAADPANSANIDGIAVFRRTD